MLATLAAVLLGANPVSLAIPGLQPVNISLPEANLYSETLADDLISLKLKVMTNRDIATVVGLERQKELLGCAEGGSTCFTELAGAIGADGILVGDIGKIGNDYLLDVKVLKPDGSVLALFNARVARAEQVPDTLNEGARSIAHQLAQSMNRPELEPAPLVTAAPPPPVAQPKTGRAWALAPLGLAVVGLGLGGGLQAGAGQQYDLLVHASYPKQARDAKATGQGLELGGNLALAVGAVALVAAVVWFFYAGGFE